MKKVLIATQNRDKFKAVSKIFKATIFPEDEYEIESLNSINEKIEDTKEEGDNIQRAMQKAEDAKQQLLNYDFEYIVGLDDAIRIKGKLEPNIKEYLNKILYEDYLKDGEEYSFSRAYAFIHKDSTKYVTTAEIPYIYRSNKNVIIDKYGYPLGYVAYPIGYDLPINGLNEKEELNYYLKYVKDALINLNIK